jgi:hypothetical protein
MRRDVIHWRLLLLLLLEILVVLLLGQILLMCISRAGRRGSRK